MTSTPTLSVSADDVELTDLPVEIIAHILSLTDMYDICSAAQTCKLLHEASQWDSIWKAKAVQEYKVPNLHSPSWKYQDLYCYLLHWYGYLIGMWHYQDDCYGALIQVSFDADNCCLQGHEVRPPQSPHILLPTRKKRLFTVRISRKNSENIECCFRYPSPHRANIIKNGVDGFELLCGISKAGHTIYKPSEYFPHWISDEYDWNREEEFEVLFNSDFRVRRCLAQRKREYGFNVSRFQVPDAFPNAIIKPGVFKGTYRLHGLEFVKLFYKGGGSIIQVDKVTGDGNVPVGQITNLADLSRPMILTEEQQSADNLWKVDIQDLGPGVDLGTLPVQPFIVPQGWAIRGVHPPATCKARFHGKGLIAGVGFVDPKFSIGHWILFDENMFGFLWMGLQVFSLYSRVIDPDVADDLT